MDSLLSSEDCCLVIVDVQGKLAGLMHEKDAMVSNICVLIKAAKSLEIPIIFCQQVPTALGDTVEPIKELLDGVEPVNKSCFSGWRSGEFKEKLIALKRRDILLCGIETHICIYQTAVDLQAAGLNVTVIGDAVSSRTVQNKQIGLDRIQACGGKILSVEMLLFELLKTAEHPKFREIAKLIK